MHRALLLTVLFVVLGCSGLVPLGPSDPADDSPVVFEVPQGSSARQVGRALVQEGFIASDIAWRIIERVEDVSCFKAGKHELRRSMTSHEICETLCGAPLANDIPFTILEGWRIRDVDAALVEKGLIQPGDYADIALNKKVPAPFKVEGSSFEGYLWPETYRVPAEQFDSAALVSRQLDAFKTNFLDRHESYGKRTLHEIVVMASLLEREEPKPSKRPLVAGILWNRIDKGWQLGVDATSRYTLEKWNDRRAFLVKLRDPNDPYNTRIHKGLPPTAIGAPTLASLEAAINPESTPYMYYLHDAQKNLHPARNADEHEKNRARFNVY